MFKRNEGHLQADMFGSTKQLPEGSQRRLEESWAGTFYRDFFCRIDEDIFADLYSDQPSRPNTPVNLLVGFEVLKAGHGWSDEQAHDAVRFDLQVRHALGLHNLADDVFTLRTVYNFRRALAEHAATTGENLFEVVFEQVTGEQLQVYEIDSTKLRMDSTQIASNIRTMSRLQLLAEVVQRMHRALDAADRERLAEDLAPYVEKPARHYARQLSGDEPGTHLRRMGELMARLVDELADKYGDTPAYGTLKRVLRDHFVVTSELVLDRLDREVSAQSLQSPDDPEATFRRKAGRKYRGYVANVTETCDETNDAQLVVDVAVEPNSADDGQMLLSALEELTERTEVAQLYTDGGYNGPAVDKALAGTKIEQYQTGIRGGVGQGLGREAFDWEVDDDQRPVAVECPGGQRTVVEQGRKSHTFLARFDEEVCGQCPHRDDCPARPRKRRPERVLRITFRQVQAARRIRRSEELHRQGINPRAAVEATVWSLKAPFRRGRVPYRGLARVTMFTIASAAMVNVRRLSALASRGPDNALGGSVSRLYCSSKALSDPLRRILKGIGRLIQPRTGASQTRVPICNRA